ncbi:MAG: hypothetical protein NC311_00495 [Muribaculaceae bacterium]|nr:hypothetical protein [Muribaculaceae bacterium]
MSEADFQASFTRESELVFKDVPDVKIYREFPVLVYDTKWRTIYIDIMIVANGHRYPIELKYKTNRIDSDAEYEGTGIPIKDILKPQGAYDIDSYDCWKDISRIEKLIDNGFAHSGVFICITNDKYYWNGNCGENTLAYAFRMNAGRKYTGEYNWNLSTSKNPEKVLAERPNLHITNNYEFVWYDFYEMPAPNGLFKYLLLEIPGKA